MTITIASPLLSFTEPAYTAGACCQVELEENNYATLAVISYGANEVIAEENPISGEAIALPDNFTPTTVVINGEIFTPAVNPESPQQGEYLYNPYTNTVQVYFTGEKRSLQIIGTQPPDIPVIPPQISPPFPLLLQSLPLQGTIQLNRSFEQQPSANFEFESTLSKGFLQTVFAPGTELDFYGLPLRINNNSITELARSIYPDMRCKVSVSLGSRWENYLDQPCFLRSDGGNSTSSEPFQDPDCATNNQQSAANNSSTTISSLLAKVKIRYTGPNLKPVPIPRDTPKDATVNPVQLLTERLRVANSFVRWSNPQAVEVIPISGLRTWAYQEAEILGEVETNYEAIARLSKRRASIPSLNPLQPDLINFPSTITPPPVPQLRGELPTALGFEYPNVELSGEFSQPQDNNNTESTQGNSKPRYVRIPQTRNERVDGDKNADVPLEGVTSVQAMSLCFDIGGQTKTRTTITEEGGTKIKEVLEIWGFAYTADSIYNDATGKLSGTLEETWKCLKRTTTEYIYDKNTGYLLYILESGYNTVRYKQENADNPETLQLDPSESEYSLYGFFQIPVISRTSYFLSLMPEYTSEGLFELVKVCNRDGTSRLEPLVNPDYAPPYYVEYERSESVAFASRPNPENEGITVDADTKLAPDLIVGEESRFETYTTIIPAKYEMKWVGSEGGYPVYERGAELSPQKIIKYIKKFKAQGQAIASALEEISIEESTGDPPVAQRRAPLYKREEPAPPPNQTQKEETKYRYFLQTAGYSKEDPVGGSESFSVAKTFEEALTAARCKLAIENWRNGLTETLQIPGNLNIAEGDRFNYTLNGEYRQRVVLGVQHTLNILGVVNGVPRITLTGSPVATTEGTSATRWLTAITSLTLGRWALPGLTYNKIPLPKEPKPPGVNIVVTNVINENLGNIIDWARVRSRRNP